MKKEMIVLLLVGLLVNINAQDNKSAATNFRKSDEPLQTKMELKSSEKKESTKPLEPSQKKPLEAQESQTALAKAKLKGQSTNTKAYYFLGLDPKNNSVVDYKKAKQQLLDTDPEKFKTLLKIEQVADYRPRRVKISREAFNDLSEERKKHLLAHPERYIIQD